MTVTLCDTNIVKQIHRKSRGWDDSHQNKEELLKAIKSAVIKTVNIEKIFPVKKVVKISSV